MKFRKLRANEIDARIAIVKDNGLSLLLYKDARVDQNLLDETVGSENWQRKHYECKGNLFCSVGIKCADEWVWKDDCGAESYTEKEKGEASDSFKRACFNWGIGRELYTAPFIWIDSTQCKITNTDGKPKCFDNFYVKEIGYDEQGNINKLKIINSKTKQSAFSMGLKEESIKDEKVETITKSEAANLLKLLDARNVNIEALCKQYKVSSLNNLTAKQYGDILRKLNESEKTA